jgi:DNA-directed RNA polymerase III subunit RPC4
MMQMPTDIPIDPPSHSKPGEFQSTLVGEHLNGRLGQIVVYESGAVKLRVGDVLFDVSRFASRFCFAQAQITQTQPISFEQEVCVIDDDEKACIRVAPLAQRLVCTPDLEHLLERRLNTIHVQGGLTE